ncbi:hypothetical protein ElyMa_003962800 [Elysia marginata]|uniref:Uncharacterized protein n=1 Tax=Elysia marginata TaxID=1093978 RepID=A0AAV4FUV0_9GAST|nr:hypothetical protein ElyMa_003962800 [Elysia marginata]
MQSVAGAYHEFKNCLYLGTHFTGVFFPSGEQHRSGVRRVRRYRVQLFILVRTESHPQVYLVSNTGR